MEFGGSLTSRLPAPRDDEPPGLRDDIADELADHLACSLQRELLRGGDPSAAGARVLEQFGDPAAVARRLWFDAMKGKILAQRVLIGTCLVLAAACVALVGLVWQQSIQAQRKAARESAETARFMASMTENAQARDHEMLKQLQKMSDAMQNPRIPRLESVLVQAHRREFGRPSRGWLPRLDLEFASGRRHESTLRCRRRRRFRSCCTG